MNVSVMDPEIFWHSRPWLQYVHDDAKYRRLNPFGLLLAVLARLSALTPPNVEVQVSPSWPAAKVRCYRPTRVSPVIWR